MSSCHRHVSALSEFVRISPPHPHKRRNAPLFRSRRLNFEFRKRVRIRAACHHPPCNTRGVRLVVRRDGWSVEMTMTKATLRETPKRVPAGTIRNRGRQSATARVIRTHNPQTHSERDNTTLH